MNINKFDQLPDVIFDKIIQFILIQPQPMSIRVVNKRFCNRINYFLKLTIKCQIVEFEDSSVGYVYRFNDADRTFNINEFCHTESRHLWPLVKTVAISIRGKSDLINILNIFNGKTAEECYLIIQLSNAIEEPILNETALSNNIDTLRNQFPNFCIQTLIIERAKVSIEFIHFLVQDQSELTDFDIEREGYHELVAILNGDILDSFNEPLQYLRLDIVSIISITNQDNIINLLTEKFPNLTSFNPIFSRDQCPNIELISKWKYLMTLSIRLYSYSNIIPLDYTRLKGKLINLKEFNLEVFGNFQLIQSADQLIIGLSLFDMPNLVRCDIQLYDMILELDSLMQLLTTGFNRILKSIIDFKFKIPDFNNNEQTRRVYRNGLIELIQQCPKLTKFRCEGIGQLIYFNYYELLRSLPISTELIEISSAEACFNSLIFNIPINNADQLISINRQEMVRLIFAINDIPNKEFQLAFRINVIQTKEALLNLETEFYYIFTVISHVGLLTKMQPWDFDPRVEWLLINGRKRTLAIILCQ